ncbi:phosphoribosyl-AMP cyclohydrolase [Olsenella sp. YH-ols2217]|uniref:Phosphoribosyl-AMP cyclohydrolase n=1 Tax=Kribbibacterium absianum TaxID=3044210 RepID=A0ABT6ZIA1_9ACTN|nr:MULTISPECIES: phosphoribosyl-AMP cyclohydrolase [unclassified Olsenella]MDJ1121285.1 phosphoribosyl-AMP cyclohydrolase [Olsenella sp. YH-ols2216]MDJ1128775.1 phosphoribosyl-AMP cyclohydrolase [Olsenella sp. YH-ols2217]
MKDDSRAFDAPGSYAGVQVAVVDVAQVRLDPQGLVPAVVQAAETGEVLMVAWMNEESLKRTLETGTTWFWSRSRQELWNKGATSGNVQTVRRVLIDCDGDTLVVLVDSPGPACHTGHRSCFYRELSPTASLDVVESAPTATKEG